MWNEYNNPRHIRRLGTLLSDENGKAIAPADV
jgi:hypothetical protein